MLKKVLGPTSSAPVIEYYWSLLQNSGAVFKAFIASLCSKGELREEVTISC